MLYTFPSLVFPATPDEVPEGSPTPQEWRASSVMPSGGVMCWRQRRYRHDSTCSRNAWPHYLHGHALFPPLPPSHRSQRNTKVSMSVQRRAYCEFQPGSHESVASHRRETAVKQYWTLDLSFPRRPVDLAATQHTGVEGGVDLFSHFTTGRKWQK